MTWHEEYRKGLEDVAAALNAIAEQQRIANLISIQRLEYAAGNSNFEATLWNEHIGPALGFVTPRNRTAQTEGSDHG